MSKLIGLDGDPIETKPPQMWPTILVTEDSTPPTMASRGAAGYDISSSVTIEIPPKTTVLVSTGLKMALPIGFVGLLLSRSGLGVKKNISIAQGVGVIDSDYRGEIMVPLYNRGDESYTVKKEDRIAQMIFLPYAILNFKFVVDEAELPSTERGQGGFGSTGV